MVEAKWLACTDPFPMLKCLRGKVGQRKLRLFACACCRRIWRLLVDERSRRAVEIAEQYAAEPTIQGTLQTAFQAADNAFADLRMYGAGYGYAATAARLTASVNFRKAANHCISIAELVTFAAADNDPRIRSSPLGYEGFRSEEKEVQCSFLRDIFGPLAFREVSIDSRWLAWNDGTVRRLAEAIYEERSLPDGLLDATGVGVLADALEDAGCADPILLEHLRGQGPHVRGCWAVDLLVGRE